MRTIKKISLAMGMIILFGTPNINAAYYTVQDGDNLNKIVSNLGFNSIEESGIKNVPSGDLSKIFPGDEIEYKTKIKRHFYNKKQKIAKVKTKSKFCFKNSNSIHYRASQKCK